VTETVEDLECTQRSEMVGEGFRWSISHDPGNGPIVAILAICWANDQPYILQDYRLWENWPC